MQREAAQALGLIGHPQKKVLPWLRFSLTNTEKQSGALAGKSKLHPAAVWVCSCVTSSPSPCSLQLASGTLVPSGKRNCQMNSLARRQKFRQTATTPGREAGAGWAPGTDSKGEAPCSRSPHARFSAPAAPRQRRPISRHLGADSPDSQRRLCNQGPGAGPWRRQGPALAWESHSISLSLGFLVFTWGTRHADLQGWSTDGRKQHEVAFKAFAVIVFVVSASVASSCTSSNSLHKAILAERFLVPLHLCPLQVTPN